MRSVDLFSGIGGLTLALAPFSRPILYCEIEAFCTSVLVARMRELKNPTRWCSVGCMSAVAKLAKPSGVELIDYRQAVDEQGNALVSSASMAMLA